MHKSNLTPFSPLDNRNSWPAFGVTSVSLSFFCCTDYILVSLVWFFIHGGEREVWACGFVPGSMWASGNNVVAYVVWCWPFQWVSMPMFDPPASPPRKKDKEDCLSICGWSRWGSERSRALSLGPEWVRDRLSENPAGLDLVSQCAWEIFSELLPGARHTSRGWWNAEEKQRPVLSWSFYS